MAKIELDWSYENHRNAVAQACKVHNVQAKLIKLSGPAGGTPLLVHRDPGGAHLAPPCI